MKMHIFSISFLVIRFQYFIQSELPLKCVQIHLLLKFKSAELILLTTYNVILEVLQILWNKEYKRIKIYINYNNCIKSVQDSTKGTPSKLMSMIWGQHVKKKLGIKFLLKEEKTYDMITYYTSPNNKFLRFNIPPVSVVKPINMTI